MRKSKQFQGMPVISLEEGQQVGTIKGLVINPALKNVAALIIEQKGWFREQKFIPFSKVHKIGDDAVTVDRITRAEKGVSLPEILRLIKERVTVLGSRLVTESGTVLGVVDEYYVDLQTGDIVGLEFSGGTVSNLFKGSAFLDINYVRTLGSSLIICSDSSLDNIVKMDGGLKETFRVFSENTGQLLENTYQKTRGWGRNLNQSISQSIEKLRKIRKTGDDPAGEDTCGCGRNKDEKEPPAVEPPASLHPPDDSPPADGRPPGER
ncbi:MAG: PRC-barrel domain-containing protein [Peptococcaceae bacterium]|nr:PRC-barrel domain-containing protein [Peptococcaceae bacterium]